MIQLAQGSFRQSVPNTINGHVNVQDNTNNPATEGFGQPGWSGGATLIDQLLFQPPQFSSWHILSYSINAGLSFESYFNDLDTEFPIYGKLGKIFAALQLDTGPTTGGSLPGTMTYAIGAPYICPALPLPNDMTLGVTLFDPGSDPAPPTNYWNATTTVPNLLPLTASLQLAQPMQVTGSASIGIGLWICPSLLSGSGTNGGAAGGLCLRNGTYTVYYDDGVSSPTPI